MHREMIPNGSHDQKIGAPMMKVLKNLTLQTEVNNLIVSRLLELERQVQHYQTQLERQESQLQGIRDEIRTLVSTSGPGPLRRDYLGGDAVAAQPDAPRTPPHLGGHCNITHVDEGVLDYLMERFPVRSIVDIGCGPGGMVRLARQKGLRAVGVDGDPQLRELSKPGPSELILHDFTQGPLELDESFDLAWSVEFLEHVEERFQQNYMALFQKAKYVFCTAAPPGKPGIHHVNCRPADYWRNLFLLHGLLYDPETTEALKQASTMQREFVRETGMFFIRDDREGRWGPQARGE